MIYIILPVHDRLHKTRHFLESLATQTIQDYHLLLIDDGSVDGSGDEVKKQLGDKVTVITGNGSWWWGGSLHQGYKWIKKHVPVKEENSVLIMNNDTVFDPDFLAAGNGLVAGNPGSLITAYAYSLETNELLDKGVHIDWNSFRFSEAETPADINCLSTRGMITDMVTFRSLAGFHPVLLPHYLSDYEYTCRAFKKGHRLLTHPSFKLFVDETTTGVSEIKEKNTWTFLKTFFSKRHKANPVYHMSFVLLTSPSEYKYKNAKMLLIDFLQKIRNQIKK